MHVTKATKAALFLIATSFTTGALLSAAPTASQADRDFVGKVSQGGLYEVEAGKVAAMHGTAPVVRDFGILESHDHEGVNASLKQIASQTGVAIALGLNAEFSDRLARLKAVPNTQFDAFYVSDMKQIHNKDEGLFRQEASEGSAPYKLFAEHTATLVKAHLGWLNSL